MRNESGFRLLVVLLLAVATLGIRAWLFVDLPSLDTLASNLSAPSTKIWIARSSAVHDLRSTTPDATRPSR